MAGTGFYLNIWQEISVYFQAGTNQISENLKLLKTTKFHNQLQTKTPAPNFGTLPQNTDPNLQQPTHIQALYIQRPRCHPCPLLH